MAAQLLLRAARGSLTAGEPLTRLHHPMAAAAANGGLRLMSIGGRVLSEEEKAAENVYFNKLEHEKLEKLAAQMKQHHEEATVAAKQASEALSAAKEAHKAAETAAATAGGGGAAAGALYALGGVAVGVLGMYLLGPK